MDYTARGSTAHTAPILRNGPPVVEAGVWAIRNYHSTLEKRAFAGSVMTGGYLSMVVASAAMATAGLLLNSTAVVVGDVTVEVIPLLTHIGLPKV